jgi:hypothetical protein
MNHSEHTDKELERLQRMATACATIEGKVYSVINLNTVGRRLLVVREHNPAWEAEPRRVLYIARP